MSDTVFLYQRKQPLLASPIFVPLTMPSYQFEVTTLEEWTYAMGYKHRHFESPATEGSC